jgi:antibiotic biosynthesis monooxygenase (ABM) superfamily enzyme
MAIREVILYEVKPGRFDEFVAIAREAKTMIERIDVGLTSVRLGQALIAGTTSGHVSFAFEYDSLSSWATSVERENKDEALQALIKESSGPDASATVVNRVLLTDIEL